MPKLLHLHTRVQCVHITMKTIFLFLVCLIKGLSCVVNENAIVQTVEGKVKGQILTSVRNNFSYYSFKGIRYGRPTTGIYRFKKSEPELPWTGIRNALEEGAPCFAVGLVTEAFDPMSSDDCLFLNVYTPQLPADAIAKLPVLVWVHGGGYQLGSGHSEFYGPDYLITEGVVLVTLNYRLNAMGFLALESTEYPGNNGLKDIVLALKWVKRNICYFGGDPNKVTVFGQSAGGALVSFLTYSPTTVGLFKNAMSQSGSALVPWAIQRIPRAVTYEYARLLGINATSDDELIQHLATVPGKQLVEYAGVAFSNLRPNEQYFQTFSFRPVIEPPHPDAFLTEEPAELLQRGAIPDIPMLLSSTLYDGAVGFVSSKSPNDLNNDEDVAYLIRMIFNLTSTDPISKESIDKVRNRYFPNGYTKSDHAKLLTYIFFSRAASQTAKTLNNFYPPRFSTTYLMKFIHFGDKSIGLDTLGTPLGPAHSDEVGYEFHARYFNASLQMDTDEYRVVELFTKIVSDFAKTGQPWNQTKESAAKGEYAEISTLLTITPAYENEADEFFNSLPENPKPLTSTS